MGATAHFDADPYGYFYIGGPALLLIEENVDPAAPVAPTRIRDDGAAP